MKTFDTGLRIAAGFVVAAAIGGMVLPSTASARETCKQHVVDPGETSTYTQQLMIDVGDVPGHQVRVLEVHRTYPDAKANCEGLKPVESWDRGVSDYTSTNGPANGYTITVFDNGDKMFSRWSGIAHAVDNPDGSRKITFTGTYRYYGGTGRYAGLQGGGRVTCRFDPLANYNACERDEEYWIQ